MNAAHDQSYVNEGRTLEARRARYDHVTDAQVISDALYDAAADNGLDADMIDMFIHDLNHTLVVPLPTRTVTSYEVAVGVTQTRAATVYVSVVASNTGDAEEQAMDMAATRVQDDDPAIGWVTADATYAPWAVEEAEL